MPDIFVKSFSHLHGRPKADQALELLKKIASLVKPIMRKHGWMLPVLSEFFPESPNLLGMNVNGGQKILVRLRPAHSPGSFYEMEELVGTMLHELTHNVHGPHDEQFYKFLNGLEEEYEALQRSGYAGEGFYSEGKRLGTNVSHNLPPHMARQKALEAAEKRRKISVIMSGGRRLGGFTTKGTKSPRELAAEAAERRARDQKTCGSGALAQKEAAKAAAESTQDDVIDLTGDSDSDSDDEVMLIDEEPTPPASSSSTPAPVRPAVRRVDSGAGISRPKIPKPQQSRARLQPLRTITTPTPPPTPLGSRSAIIHASPPSPVPQAGDAEWVCPRCTLVNQARVLQCAVCELVRPQPERPKLQRMRVPEPGGWTCAVCQERGIPNDFWSCTFCGTVKSDSSGGGGGIVA